MDSPSHHGNLCPELEPPLTLGAELHLDPNGARFTQLSLIEYLINTQPDEGG